MITGAQIQAARKLLGWSRARLGHRVRLSTVTMRRIEGMGTPIEVPAETMDRIQAILEAAGVEFAYDDGSEVGVRSIEASRRCET